MNFEFSDELLQLRDQARRCLVDRLLYSPALRLAGGTDEIMKNIIAERVLGLPQHPRADKGLAFRDIPTGARK